MITEETQVDYTNDSELSYFDDANDTVSLYINDKFEGDIKVWKDSQMDGREYICLNHTIVYLDTLSKVC